MISNGTSLTGFEHAQAARLYCDLSKSRPQLADDVFKRYVVKCGLVPEGAVIDIRVEEQPVTPDLDDLWVVVGFSYSVVGGVTSEYLTFSILALRQPPPAEDGEPRLVELDSDILQEVEGHVMYNALASVQMRRELRAAGSRVFSFRTSHGQSVLCMSVNDGLCSHVVGFSNRPPTPTELEQLRPLLAARQITLQYDARTYR